MVQKGVRWRKAIETERAKNGREREVVALPPCEGDSVEIKIFIGAVAGAISVLGSCQCRQTLPQLGISSIGHQIARLLLMGLSFPMSYSNRCSCF